MRTGNRPDHPATSPSVETSAPKLLVVSSFPIRKSDKVGSSSRIQAMLGYLKRDFEIHLLYTDSHIRAGGEPDCFTSVTAVAPVQTGLVEKVGLRVLHLVRKVRGDSVRLRLWRQNRPSVRHEVKKCLNQLKPDAVLFEYAWSLFPALGVSRGLGIPSYVDTHDVLSERYRLAGENGNASGVMRISRRYEQNLYRKVDVVLGIQESDVEELEKMCPGHPVLEVGHSAGPGSDPSAAEKKTGTVLFLGSASSHNLDALRNFLERHWPRVLNDCPDARLDVVGAVCSITKEQRMEIRNVRWHGEVDDVTPFFEACQVSLNVPRFGGGLKIKAVEGFRMGLCQVMTPVGAKGLERYSSAYAVCGEERIGEMVSELIRDPVRCETIAREAATTYAEYFSPDAVYGPLRKDMLSRAVKGGFV